MTQETVEQTLENLKEIRRDAQRSIDRLTLYSRDLRRPSPNAPEAVVKDYEDSVKEYSDAVALIRQMEEAYAAITTYYLLRNRLRTKK